MKSNWGNSALIVVCGMIASVGPASAMQLAVKVHVEGTGLPCAGAATPLWVSSRPALTDLQEVGGQWDGAAIWANANVEAAYFDYVDEDGGEFLYLLTGQTTQYSCTFTCMLASEELVQWSVDLARAAAAADLGNLTVPATAACGVFGE